ncbi:hypothetical protein GCM10025857_30010 [Alicyclobacillus contaminans]|nr:hypothetical protein GCM10025857_30010 [Alicyclobacillus contaminans]
MSEEIQVANELATFAGGCFWCMVKPFDQWPGVLSVTSGYTGGHVENPTYEEVCSGTTGHREAVQIVFQPEVLPYERLLEIFWQQIDPTDAGGNLWTGGRPTRLRFIITMSDNGGWQKRPSANWRTADGLTSRL